MIKHLAALAVLSLATTAPAAFDISTYTATGLFTNEALRTAIGLPPAEEVRVRGVSIDPTVADTLVLFVSRTNNSNNWIVNYNLATPGFTVVGGNSLAGLKGSPSSLNQGSFATGAGLAVYNDNPTFGNIVGLNLTTGVFNGAVVSNATDLGFVGSLAYLGGTRWVGIDSRNNASQNPIRLIDTAGPTVTNSTVVAHDSRAIVPIGNNAILMADRWNRILNHITDLDTTPVINNITPPGDWGFAVGQRQMVDLAGISTDLYAILDDSPAGFNDELLAIWDGTAITDISLADISVAAGGVSGDLNVNFHNGIFMHQPDANTLHLYVANFNSADALSGVYRVEWTQASSVSDWQLF